MKTKEQIIGLLKGALSAVGAEGVAVALTHPTDTNHGDYASNVALVASKKLGKNPRELAEELVAKMQEQKPESIEKIEIAGPGFINFFLSNEALVSGLESAEKRETVRVPSTLSGKKIMVEYAHPNTHKEMHIGHMRTLITGEAIARLAEAAGAEVFRANYQGDIGPHIAKALYGIQKLMEEQHVTLDEVEKWSNKDKTHFLGLGYVRGSQDYEEYQEEIDAINKGLYEHNPEIRDMYQRTRQWNLDYYDEFYQRFYTTFDRLFFESEMAEPAIKIVTEHLGTVFEKSEGAIIFPGEKYGLHTRVFISQKGLPLYEAKDIANAYKQYEAFPFDKNIHVVASEQAGYFQVVIKALELIDPDKFKDREQHLSMGMVQLSDRKMSSRTGDILTVDWLLDEIKTRVEKLMEEGRISAEDKDRVIEQIVIGAVKYSVLKVGTGQDVAFDIAKSVSLDGDSGPYLQYTFARTQSVLRKSQTTNPKSQKDLKLEIEERDVLRQLSMFEEVVQDAAEKHAPNILAGYLFDLAQKFNLFYQKHTILKSEREAFRLSLTDAVGKTLKSGLDLLGIQAPERM